MEIDTEGNTRVAMVMQSCDTIVEVTQEQEQVV